METRYHPQRPYALWELSVATDRVYQAALAWKWLAENLRARLENLAASDARVRAAGWSGEAREGFEEHRWRLAATMEAAAEEADHLHTVLQGLADEATSRQYRLIQNRSELEARYRDPVQSTPEMLALDVPAEKHDEVMGLLAEAEALRQGFDEYLGMVQFSGNRAWEALSEPWEGVANGTAAPFHAPGEGTDTLVFEVDGTTVVNTGAGADDVRVSRDTETGDLLVTVNGVAHNLGSSRSIVVRTGAGKDTVIVEPGTRVKLILGGADTDTITVGTSGTAILAHGGSDRVFAFPEGGGARSGNYISGNGGNDYLESRGDSGDLIFGGSGADTIYAGEGRDDVLPGEGFNYADAGPDADRVFARWDDARDLDSGGPGEDLRTGGVGWEYHDRHDVVDPASAAVGAEKNVVYIASDPPREVDLSFITIEGSPEFVERVRADLHTLSRTYAADATGSLYDAGFRLSDLERFRNGDFLPFEHSLTIREAPADATETATRKTSSFLGNRSTVIHYNPVKNVPDTPLGRGGGFAAEDLMRELAQEAEAWRR